MSQPPEIEGMVELVLHKVLGCRSPGPSRALCPGWAWSRHLLVLGEGPSLTPQSPLWAVSLLSSILASLKFNPSIHKSIKFFLLKKVIKLVSLVI